MSTEAPTRQEKPSDIDRVWFKVWNDVLTDMRFVTMPLDHQAIWLRLVVLSNHRANVGRVIGTRKDIAAAIRVPEKKLNAALDEFEEKSIVYVSGNTIDFADERHYLGVGLRLCDTREEAAERQRRSRAKNKLAEETRIAKTPPCHSDVSQPRGDGMRWDDDEQEESESKNRSCHQKEVDYYQGDEAGPLATDAGVPLL